MNNLGTRRKLGERRCKQCNVIFTKTKPLQYVCSISCAIAYSKSKEEKKKEKQLKERKKAGLEKIKSLADWKNDLQKQINWIVKKLDADYPCISHPNMKGFLRYDAGHAFTVKVHSDIRFNLHNIHKQSSEANQRYGFCAEYADGIRNRYGQQYLDMLLGLPLQYKGIGKEKYTIQNIKEIYLPNARKVVKNIKLGRTYTRDEVNQIIGIYV